MQVEGKLSFRTLSGTVTYHDSCHLSRALRVHQESRLLLQKTGLNLVEMDGSDLCCGFGGAYSIKFSELSMPILGRKMKDIEAAKADLVAMDCPGCLLQISGGPDQRNSSLGVRHTAEILASAIELLK